MQHKMHLNDSKKYHITLDLKEELKNFQVKEKKYTIPIFIPHKGCKNECVFCNQRKISGVIQDVTPQDVKVEIEEYLKYFNEPKTQVIEIAFFGGSFTGIPLELQKQYLQVANEYIKTGQVKSIRLSTRPDYITIPILKMLKQYHVETIELGVQSMDDTVLKLSKRGHTSKEVVRASKLIRLFDFRLGHQTMIGLPGSNLQSELETIQKILKGKPEDLRIYPVYVIDPSELYTMYQNKEYIPLTLEEAIFRCQKVIHVCQNTNVRIIRLGLQSTDIIREKNKEIVGPVSDNFAEYVMAELVKEKIESIVKEKGYRNGILEITVPSKYVSVTVGPKKVNKLYFEQKYSLEYNVKGDSK